MKIIIFRTSTIIIDRKWCDFNNISLYIMKNSVDWVVTEKKIWFYIVNFFNEMGERREKNLTRYILDMEILVQAQIGEHPGDAVRTGWVSGSESKLDAFSGGEAVWRWVRSQDLWPLNFPCMMMSLWSSIEREKIGGFSLHDLGCRDRSSHGAAIREETTCVSMQKQCASAMPDCIGLGTWVDPFRWFGWLSWNYLLCKIKVDVFHMVGSQIDLTSLSISRGKCTMK